MAHLDAWLVKTGCKLPSYEAAYRATHFRLDGGKLCVPDKLHGDFVEMLGRDLFHGRPWHLVERRTPFFNMFVDLDLKDSPEALPVRDICLVTHDVVSHHAMSSAATETTATVCLPRRWDRRQQDRPHFAARLIPNSDEGVLYRHRGVHIIWDVVVNADVAMHLRDAILKRCQERWSTQDWEKLVDSAVYKGSGLRMAGCHKGDVASLVYWPVYRLSGREATYAGVPCNTLTDVIECVRMSTIRYLDKPPTQIDVPPPKKCRAAKKSDLVCEKQIELFDIINQTLLPVYRNNDRPKLEDHGTTPAGVPFWNVTNRCKFCLNKGSEHRNQHVWFKVTPTFVYQFCYDQDHVGVYGPCKKFRSPGMPVPKHLQQRLLKLSR